MSFSGFALKGKKKGATAAGLAQKSSLGGFRVEKERNVDEKKEIVVGFSTSGDALLKEPSAGSKYGPMVIPCIKVNWTEDQAAAEALLADIRNSSRQEQEESEESTLVIPIAGGTVENTSDINKKDAPMLTRNRIPGMDKIVGETNKFKHDLSMRPDELDIHSDAFDAVPIEEFGAALLRGMGWTGKDRVEPTGSKVQMRHYRLGLGATPKPVIEAPKKKNFIPKPEPRERSSHHGNSSSTRNGSRTNGHKRSRSRSRDRSSKKR
ncbi:hypothetical protein DYB28_001276 [Aphanomyces astaci]|uniref:Spp2/MOS2 G-patch domain-containing protein n=1 Tax=Aphanomyces astaci TaxID=112090 RepID=A0A397DJJ1_APHAT|nr:hypothetical protein DYB25_012840 [Aphanomyces astaci]RHY19980.1 hypothetical protein DYB36_011899 [Aphanomyces astaci]RHY63761.1 hypothetical protein DYB38_011576 [Aphanomyces astaci]RHZ15963.1 hypothetical protein DYB31_013695 [Aphanomyces astaci]RLO00595.1 hypothetical protein DYB28_001276 [Aphanomyces astaci]